MKKNKTVIIILIIILIIAIITGIYFFYQYRELKKPIKQKWGQKYYMYLKDISENKKQNDAGLPKDLKKSELSFYESENIKDPVMVIDYMKDNQKYSNVYYIYNDSVNVLVYKKPSQIELLYNIQNKKYDYYSHVKDGENNRYKSISEQINERIKELEKGKTEEKVEENTEYNYNSESVDKIVDINGKEISLNKFDETFIKPDIKENKTEYNYKLDETNLKTNITNQINNYKPVEKIVTDNIQKQIQNKIEKVENIKKEMENAKAEVEKKEAEEKAKKEAEEREKAEKEGFKIGSYTLKYGRYEWDLAEVGDYGHKEVYILNSDKTCSHTDYEGKTTSCTFKIGRATDGQSIESMVERDALIINENGGYSRSYFPKTDGFRDTDLENFLYKGSN